MMRLIIFILLFFCHMAWAQQAAWKTLSEANYSIEYPSDWTLDQSGRMGTTFIVMTEMTSAEDRFRENINLIIQDLSASPMTLSEYVELTQSQLSTVIQNPVIKSTTRTLDHGIESHTLVFTGVSGPFNLKFKQRYWIKDNRAYALTLTCEEAVYDTYISTGDRIISSFAIQ